MLQRDFCVGFGLLACLSMTACTSTNSSDNMLTKQDIWGDEHVFSWKAQTTVVDSQAAKPTSKAKLAEVTVDKTVVVQKEAVESKKTLTLVKPTNIEVKSKPIQVEPQEHLRTTVMAAEAKAAEPEKKMDNPINQSDISVLAAVSAEDLTSIIPASYDAGNIMVLDSVETVEVVEEETPAENDSILNVAYSMVDKVIDVAQSMLGIPYVWGGNKPDKGFDCSGLVQYSFGWADVKLPRTAAAQYNYVTPVKLDELLPGDIVFFKTSRRARVTHNGIYIGKGQFIHAPSTGKTIRYAKLNNSYWKKRIVGAGRVDKLHHIPCVPSNGDSDSEIVEIKPKSKEYL